MKNVRLVASDMDHTLLTEDNKLPEGFGGYVDRLYEKKIHFIAASGRPMYSLKEMFTEYEDRMGFISDNGALIEADGKIIYKNLIPEADYKKMIQFVRSQEVGIPLLCALDSVYILKEHKCYESIYKRFFSKISYVDDLQLVSSEANKFTVFFPEHDAKEYLNTVYSNEFGRQYHVTIGGDEWIDIMNEGINKGSAIKVLAEYYELSLDQTMAFGDTYNDIEMLRIANFSYVMKNASEEMKQYGKYQADSNQNYGVLKVLDKLLIE